MDLVTAAVLGFVQGVTEFLPISSSGHLVLAQNLFGMKEPQLLFDVILHAGTLTAVVVFVRREIAGLVRALLSLGRPTPAGLAAAWRDDAHFRLLVFLVVGSAPTALIGLMFKDVFEALFASTSAVGWALIATGVILAASKFAPAGARPLGRVGLGRALIVGAAQGLAIIPGVSRSGTTIAAGLFLGLERQSAARFSFLLSLPAVIGALGLELVDSAGSNVPLSASVVGFIAAAFSGYLALVWLMRLLAAGRFFVFAPYVWLVGAATLLLTG